MTMESVSFAFAGEPAVDHPLPFRRHTSSKKNRPSSRGGIDTDLLSVGYEY